MSAAKSAARTAVLVIWLVAYTLLPAGLALFALIFAFEGAAALRTHPQNLLLTVAATLFLVAWPLSALAGWVLLAFGRRKTAWLVTVGAAAVLLALWLGGLLAAAAFGR